MQGLLQRNRGAKKSLSKAKEIGGKRKHFRFVIGPSPEGPTKADPDHLCIVNSV